MNYEQDDVMRIAVFRTNLGDADADGLLEREAFL
jgi:hypothetical protein